MLLIFRPLGATAINRSDSVLDISAWTQELQIIIYNHSSLSHPQMPLKTLSYKNKNINNYLITITVKIIIKKPNVKTIKEKHHCLVIAHLKWTETNKYKKTVP